VDLHGSSARLERLFTTGFTALEIAEPLVSFDDERDAKAIATFMDERRLRVVGVRRDGGVRGVATRAALDGGCLNDHRTPFDAAAVVDETAPLRDVITILEHHPQCFVSMLGQVGAIVTRTDVGKPPARMWLFGMVTLTEMIMVRRIEDEIGDEWREMLSASRLDKARALQDERRRRNQDARLIDCLQLSDKARILLRDPDVRADAGFESMRTADRALKQLESLRNHLAHAQDIVGHDWPAIAMVSSRIDRLMSRLGPRAPQP